MIKIYVGFEEFFRTFFDNLLDLRIGIFSVIYWDRSTFNYRFIYLFILKLFCNRKNCFVKIYLLEKLEKFFRLVYEWDWRLN